MKDVVFDSEISEGYSSEETLTTFIIQKMNKFKTLSCVFDDYNTALTDTHLELFHSNGFSYNNKVYYLVRPDQLNPNLINKAIWHSNAIWHSLCVLTDAETSLLKPGSQVTKTDIENLCRGIQNIIVVAYDNEGFLYWEKN